MVSLCDEDWARRLATALEQIYEAESLYLDELSTYRKRRELEDARYPRFSSVYDPAEDRFSLYYSAHRSTGFYEEERYLPLRAALKKAADVVGEHPVLTPALGADGHEDYFSVFIPRMGRSTSRIRIVAGLMCRASQVGKEGFRVASDELNSLFAASLEEDLDSGELGVGYHVSLFYGLQLSKNIEIADGLLAVPLEHTESFLNRDVLERVIPGIGRQHKWEAVGAILTPFPWKPKLLHGGDVPESSPDWGDRVFFENAHTFTELLALTHCTPVVTLMDIPCCTHRTASLLLGIPHHHVSWTHNLWARAYEGLDSLNLLDAHAFDQAKDMFSRLNNQRFGGLEPVVSRLSESLARTGRYAEDDKILDVAIALEQIYGLDQGEISFKLKIRAACFLESDTKARLRVYGDVERLYDERSKIVHKRKAKHDKKFSVEAKHETFKKGFNVARNSVIKLLLEGSPEDWTKIILDHEKGQ